MKSEQAATSRGYEDNIFVVSCGDNRCTRQTCVDVDVANSVGTCDEMTAQSYTLRHSAINENLSENSCPSWRIPLFVTVTSEYRPVMLLFSYGRILAFLCPIFVPSFQFHHFSSCGAYEILRCSLEWAYGRSDDEYLLLVFSLYYIRRSIVIIILLLCLRTITISRKQNAVATEIMEITCDKICRNMLLQLQILSYLLNESYSHKNSIFPLLGCIYKFQFSLCVHLQTSYDVSL